jgi:ribonucleoside-diphosphate reductase beta chain
LLKQDESRHNAYVLHFPSRLLAGHSNEWVPLDAQMNIQLPFAIGVIGDTFACCEVVPFGSVEDEFVNHAMNQFTKRFEQLEKAKGATLDEINRVAKAVEEA